MVNKKKRLFKILFFPISLLICLSIFMINSFAQSGYRVDNSGNVESLNLFNANLDYTENQTYNYYYSSTTLQLTSTNGYNCLTSFKILNYEPNKTYTISFGTITNTNNAIAQVGVYDGDDIVLPTRIESNDIISFTTRANATQLNIVFYTKWITHLGGYGTSTIENIMLNEGDSPLDYFPYGYYYSNSVLQNYSIYNIFSEATVWLSNLTSDGAIISENFDLNVDDTYITFNNLPNIRSYILNHPTLEPFTLTIYFGPSNPQNASFVITLNSYDWQPTVKLSGFSDKVFNRSNNSNTFIVNTFNENYSTMSIIDFEASADVVNSFRISLVQADTSYYNNGYRDGYNNGFNEGENVGFNSGYQSGYNTGTTTNIETNGIRTLFNSILSFPVDMIKSVFNFEFMGVNISSVIMFIVSIGIVAFVLKKFL